jgi:type III pantothenate kinase
MSMIDWLIDIGNTDLVLGVWGKYNTEPQINRLKIKSVKNDSPQFEKFVHNLYSQSDEPESISCTISSVVPAITDQITDVLQRVTGKNALFINQSTYKYLPIEILEPSEIGTDLVANALAAHLKYNTNTIIVDFGTAMSFTTIDASGKIVGVSIAPGLQTAIKSLTSNTAQLFEVPIIQPASALGKNTEHAIQAGITYGYDGLVKGIIKAQEKELDLRLNVVCTGGLSNIIFTLLDRVDHYVPHLTLEGLRAAGRIMRKKMEEETA